MKRALATVLLLTVLLAAVLCWPKANPENRAYTTTKGGDSDEVYVVPDSLIAQDMQIGHSISDLTSLLIPTSLLLPTVEAAPDCSGCSQFCSDLRDQTYNQCIDDGGSVKDCFERADAKWCWCVNVMSCGCVFCRSKPSPL